MKILGMVVTSRKDKSVGKNDSGDVARSKVGTLRKKMMEARPTKQVANRSKVNEERDQERKNAL